jgi:hypothetical protein
MRKVGISVLEAMSNYYKTQVPAELIEWATLDDALKNIDAHMDLSPSNIIVKNLRTFECALVDYGPNYLYTKALGGGDLESPFIAPEVQGRTQGPTHAADFYSLGQLVILAGGLLPSAAGVVPDDLYLWHPEVAHYVEDLLREQPEHRLSALRQSVETSEKVKDPMVLIRSQLTFEFDVARNLQEEGPGKIASTIPALFNELRPLSNEPRRFRKLAGAIRQWSSVEKTEDEGLPIDGRRLNGYVKDQLSRTRRLRWASLISASFSMYATCLAVWWLLRDMGLTWGADWFFVFEFPQWLFGMATGQPLADGGIPGLDSLRASDYRVPDLENNWYGRIVCISYALLAAKLYQSVYARAKPVRPLENGSHRVFTVAAATWMQAMPIVNFLLIFWVTAIDVRAWPAATIAGQSLIFLGNLFVFLFVRAMLNDTQAIARRDYPSSRTISGYEQVKSWVSGSLFYAIVVWVVGILILSHHLHDVGFYAVMVAGLNIGFLYIVKCGLNGPSMRTTIHRASFKS